MHSFVYTGLPSRVLFGFNTRGPDRSRGQHARYQKPARSEQCGTRANGDRGMRVSWGPPRHMRRSQDDAWINEKAGAEVAIVVRCPLAE